MTLKIDLHSHSLASDGTLSPSQLVEHAASQGVDVLALTDHDVTDGIAEAERAAEHFGLGLVPGVEVSVSWNHTTVHIVGLGVDPQNQALQEGLAKLLAFRQRRAEAIGQGLEKAGIPGAYEAARAKAKGSIISRTHFAHFLVEQGHAKSVRDVFKKFLIKGKPGHVGGQWATLEEALGWIHGAGGQAVIAHPARYRMTATRLRRLIGEFVELGGEGIEVISGSHSRDECYTMARHASQAGLKASSGSDYHGPENPWIELGALPPLPDGCTPIWADWDLPGQ
ncbi:MAG: PHP domain-containing protein [Gammaproteobacteria bacterium]|nr:PHP domain-containing protein [Gammaproteobacteria bacterium]